MTALADQIAAFKGQLGQIKMDFGSCWAVLVDKKVEAAFSEFEGAARYALANFPDQDCLIRHTDDVLETVPFMVLEG